MLRVATRRKGFTQRWRRFGKTHTAFLSISTQVGDFAAAPLNFNTILVLASPLSGGRGWLRGWLAEESEDNEDVALGSDGTSLFGGLSENVRLTGGGIGNGVVTTLFAEDEIMLVVGT